MPKQAEKVFSGRIFDVYHWQQEMFDGSQATFEMIKRQDTVNILAIRDDRIVVVRDEQPGRGAIWSLPGGRHDDESETELEAAKREMREETGLSFREWKLVECTEPIKATNKIEWLLYLFVATEFTDETEQKLDAGEKIQIEYLSYEEFLEISSGSDGGNLRDFHRIVKDAGSIDELKVLPDLLQS